jgi:hypothetical protein
MNKNIIACCGLILLAFSSCKNDASTKNAGGPANANVNTMAGYWVAIDFCSRANQYGSFLAAVNNSHLPFAFALTFTPAKPDSVEIFDGAKSRMLPVRFNVDTIEIKGARGVKPIFLVYDSKGTKDITMFDPSPSGTQLDKFIKSKAGTKDGQLAFQVALNHNLFSGTFTKMGGKATDKPMLMTPGGFITNFEDFDKFSVCTGGDCLVAGNDIDIIKLSKTKVENSEKTFGFRYGIHNDTLTIVNLDPGTGNSKQPGKPVYKFLRKISQ